VSEEHDDQAAAETVRPDAEQPDPAEEIREAEERLRRALADLDNVRKRFDREVARERAAERARVAGEWLPIVDNLERALEHAGAEGGPVVDGVRAVLDQARQVLESFGFPRFDDVGARFDPVRHEAVSAVASQAPPGTVVATVRPGYGTSDRILRPAGVIVARGSG
jgi:molecular chaperone GrpE